MTPERRPFHSPAEVEDLARRLAAAWVSHRLHLKSLDHAYKRYAKEAKLGLYWIRMAEMILDPEVGVHVSGKKEPEMPSGRIQ